MFWNDCIWSSVSPWTAVFERTMKILVMRHACVPEGCIQQLLRPSHSGLKKNTFLCALSNNIFFNFCNGAACRWCQQGGWISSHCNVIAKWGRVHFVRQRSYWPLEGWPLFMLQVRSVSSHVSSGNVHSTGSYGASYDSNEAFLVRKSRWSGGVEEDIQEGMDGYRVLLCPQVYLCRPCWSRQWYRQGCAARWQRP